MSHGLSNFSGAIAAWLCLAPVALAREPLSMPSTLAPAPAPTHYIASLSFFLIWVAAGIFLVVGGILAFAPFRFRARKLEPSSGPTRAHRSTRIDLAWTVIPVLLAILLLATTCINFAIQNVSKPGAAYASSGHSAG
jgi:cytochrome c oxidase subunit II